MALLTFYGAPDFLRYRGRAGGDVTGDVQNALTGAMSTPQMMTVIPARVEEEPSMEATPVGDKGGPIPQSESVNGDLELSEEELLAQDPRVHQPAIDNRNWLQKAWDAASGSVSDSYDYITDTDDGLLPDTWDTIKAGAGLLASPIIGVANAAESLSENGREQGKPIYGMLKDADGNPILDENGRPQYGIIGYDDSKVLMDDGKTWRDRNFMDTAFDVLRGVDRYIDPATKYFRKGMEQAATHPMGWSLAARDPQGPWATAIKGATAQREMELKERGQGDALNTMLYDINKHIDENYGPMTPEARENLVMSMVNKAIPAWKARQTQIYPDAPTTLAEKTAFESGKAMADSLQNTIMAETKDAQSRVFTMADAAEAIAQNPIGGFGQTVDTLRRFAGAAGFRLPQDLSTQAAVDRAYADLFSYIKNKVNTGPFTDADRRFVQGLIAGTANDPKEVALLFTAYSIISQIDVARSDLWNDLGMQGAINMDKVNKYNTGLKDIYSNARYAMRLLREDSATLKNVVGRNNAGKVVETLNVVGSDGTNYGVFSPYNYTRYVRPGRIVDERE